MTQRLLLPLALALVAGCAGGECLDDRQFFEQKVWGQVFANGCLKCHSPEGPAAEQNAKLLLLTPSYPAFLDANYASAVEVARIQYDGVSELLQKPLGKVAHGGGAQIKEGSVEHQVLKEMVARLANPVSCGPTVDKKPIARSLLGPEATLRRASLHLVGRLRA